MSLHLLRRAGAAAIIVMGLALFTSAVHGVTRVDTRLELAAARSAPDRAHTLEVGLDGRECDRYDDELPA